MTLMEKYARQLLGRGFYVVKDGHVIKGIVGDIILSSETQPRSEHRLMSREFWGEWLQYKRSKIIVTARLYVSPYDIKTRKDGKRIGLLGDFPVCELCYRKADAIKKLKEAK